MAEQEQRVDLVRKGLYFVPAMVERIDEFKTKLEADRSRRFTWNDAVMFLVDHALRELGED